MRISDWSSDVCSSDLGFTLEPGHANQVAPRKRPFHTIIPGFAMDLNGDPLMAFGLMGGPIQAQGHLQLALRILGYGQNPQERSEEHTSELQSLMRISYAVFCLKKKKK